MPKIAARARLMKRKVEQTAANGREAFIWDSEVPGFGMRLRTNGRKVFVFQYFTGGRTRRVNIGDYGRVTAEAARERARR
jgi:hypothetical protein